MTSFPMLRNECAKAINIRHACIVLKNSHSKRETTKRIQGLQTNRGALYPFCRMYRLHSANRCTESRENVSFFKSRSGPFPCCPWLNLVKVLEAHNSDLWGESHDVRRCMALVTTQRPSPRAHQEIFCTVSRQAALEDRWLTNPAWQPC